jgi:hypothetical protein
MTDENGTNGAGYTAPAVPTIDELRRAYEEGLPQRLLSGIEVTMRPVRADKLLMGGNMPDILTPLVMRMLFGVQPDDVEFPDEIEDPVMHYLSKTRAKAAEAVEFVRSVDAVCEAALVDPSIVPYLSLSDRLWIFKLAFIPAEVLSRFRDEPSGDVEAVSDEQGQVQAERDDAGDRPAVPVESADSVPV